LRKLILFAALAGMTAPAEAQVAPTTRQTGVNNDPNEIVCIREQEIGSRLRGRRVCRTRAAWDEVREHARQVIDRVQNQSKQTQ
jgi:hypothetical protein